MFFLNIMQLNLFKKNMDGLPILLPKALILDIAPDCATVVAGAVLVWGSCTDWGWPNPNIACKTRLLNLINDRVESNLRYKEDIKSNLSSRLHLMHSHVPSEMLGERGILHLVLQVWVVEGRSMHHVRVRCRSHVHRWVDHRTSGKVHNMTRRVWSGCHTHWIHVVLHPGKHHRNHPASRPHYLKHH